KAFESRLQQERVQRERHQASIKKANQSVSKSANHSRARFIGSLRFELNAGVLVVRSVFKSIQYPAKLIRRYLKKLGVSQLGKSLSDGVSFKGDAVTKIIDALQAKHATNLTVPTDVDFKQQSVFEYIRSFLNELSALGCNHLEAQP
ncbi:hypothetical protein BK412_25885, partial [Vibrio campbellii]|uniref:hypothetical protein n=1 Tax=Vibrio campbellii TaxID=680 RepID=UPI0009EFC65A